MATDQQKILLKLRELTKDCVSKHHLSTGRFYADKACVISGYHHQDVHMLANIHFLNKEYHRSILVLQKHGLIPHPNHMGINDVSFQNGFNNENSNSLNCSMNDKQLKCSKQEKLRYLLLGMQSFLEVGECESTISMLSESDDMALQYIQPDLIKDADEQNENNQINLSSLLCMVRAKALEKLSIDQRALWWFERSLIFDCKNIQVCQSPLCFHIYYCYYCPIFRHLIASSNGD